jgi:hypothetical protein
VKKFRVFLMTVLIVGTPLFMAANVRAGGKNRVGLVVQYGDGSVTTKCVEFDDSSITGYQLLKKAGLNPIVEHSGMGVAVCKIKSNGCDYPSEACFCECQGNPCKYWVYHHLKNGSWHYSSLGASNYEVVDGDVEGWAWGEGSPTGGLEPPIYTFDQICSVIATPTNTDIPPTATPIPPTATWTVAAPTVTPTFEPPTLTATPTPQLNYEIDFWADDESITAGSCTKLYWDTENVQAVYLDGEGVKGSGSLQVCPSQTTEYTLDVKTASGDKERNITISVASDNTATATSTGTPAATAAATVAAVAAVVETPAVLPASSTPVENASVVETDVVAVEPSPTLTAPNVPVGAISLPTRPPDLTAAQADELAMVVISAPTVTVVPQAAQQATPAESMQEVSQEERPESYHDPLPSTADGSPTGYIVFSFITMGLGGWLAAAYLRRQ